MKAFKFALPLVLALLVSTAAKAEEKPAAKEGKWTGTLAEKGADAKAGVAAVLKVKDGDKEVSVNLWADGDTAKNLADWAKKGAKVEVHGEAVDATNVKVKKAEPVKAEEKK